MPALELRAPRANPATTNQFAGGVVLVQGVELEALIKRAVREALDHRTEPMEWLNSKAAATLLGISTRTLTKRAAAGEVPAHRIGRLWRFSRAELERCLTGGE